MTPNEIAGCSNYYNQTEAPWYCSSLGYCEGTTYNTTRLGYIGYLLSNINTLPLTDDKIMALATNVGNQENDYVFPILSKQKAAQLAIILNSSVPGYGGLVNGTMALLSHISNATLQAELTALTSEYSNVTTDYISENLSLANRTLSAKYAALSGNYVKLNNTYSGALDLAANNTAKIIALQLSGTISPEISNLALSEFALNNRLTASSISNVSALDVQLMNVSSQLSSYSTSPITLTEIARGAMPDS